MRSIFIRRNGKTLIVDGYHAILTITRITTQTQIDEFITETLEQAGLTRDEVDIEGWTLKQTQEGS